LHLAGLKTISCMRSNQSTQRASGSHRCRPAKVSDLAAVQYDLNRRERGTARKSARRSPLDICRGATSGVAVQNFVYTSHSVLVPSRLQHEVEGLEIFPKQDRIEAGFMETPSEAVGIHRPLNTLLVRRATATWRQFDLIRNARRLTLAELEARTEELRC